MCTIGWIKTDVGFILFKNRDASKKYLGTSTLLISKNILAGVYTNRRGIWIGVNKYGIGFTSAMGPYRRSKEDWKRVNEIGEKVLLSSKVLDNALERFLRSFYEETLKTSANVILADKNKAYLLELFPNKYHKSICKDRCLATNHFEYLKGPNQGFKYLDVSIKRLEKAKELLLNARTVEDVANSLKYHSDNPMESICRHGNIITISSLIVEFTKGAKVLYAPGPPCSTPFTKVLWEF